MGQIKLNARDMVIEAAEPDSLALSTPTWVEVAGLTNFVVNDEENEETAETGTFQDEGNYRQEKMQKGAQVELEGFSLADSVTGVPDPGRGVLREWHERLGAASEGRVRFRHKLEDEWTVWTATCTVGERGGELNDKMSFAATLVRSGPSTKVEVTP